MSSVPSSRIPQGTPIASTSSSQVPGGNAKVSGVKGTSQKSTTGKDSGVKGSGGSLQVEPPLLDAIESSGDEREGSSHSEGEIAKPKIAHRDVAHHDLLPTQARFMEQCGRPKDNRLFGLIKMSEAYKAVLGQMGHVDAALEKQGAPSTDDIDTALGELRDLKQLADAYIDGSSKHRFSPQMRELKSQIQETMDMLTQLKSELAEQGGWPGNLTLKEAILYGRQGIPLDTASFFKARHVDAEPARQMLLSSNESVAELKQRIVDMKQALPEGLSFAEALEYQKQGIAPERARIFRDNGIPPEVAAKAITGGYDTDLPRMSRESIDFLCEKGAGLRLKIKDAGPQMLDPSPSNLMDEPHRNLSGLITQCDQATDLYVQLFKDNHALPESILNRTDSTPRPMRELKGMIEEFPVRNLSSADRETAFKLLGLIHENQSLAYTHFVSEGTQFRMPQSSIKAFGQGESAMTSLRSPQQNVAMAKNMVGLALSHLVDSDKIGAGKNNLRTLSEHLEGLVKSRPDIAVSLCMLSDADIEQAIKDWVDGLPSLSAQDKTTLTQQPDLKTLTDIISNNIPIMGKNLIVQPGEVGSGGSASVMDATFNGRPVIVKSIQVQNKGMTVGDVVQETIRQSEQQNNPHVPKVIGFGVEQHPGSTYSGDVDVFVIMDKVDGKDFDKTLSSKMAIEPGATGEDPTFRFTCGERAKVGLLGVKGMALGLEPLHRRGLYHSDIKPANIMVDSKTLMPRLIDFGGCAPAGTNSGVFTGSFCAPEQMDGFPTQAADVYAFGSSLYEMACGANFKVATPFGGFVLKSNDVLFEDTALWDSSPIMSECKELIQACTELDPDKRPTSVQILQAIRGEPITAGGETMGNPGLTPAKFHMLDALRPDRQYMEGGMQRLGNLE